MRQRNSVTLSAAMTSAALALVAIGSAAQVALYLHLFGTNRRTDGFIAAFAVYSLVVVVAQILRTTAVPLRSGAVPRLPAGDFGWAIVIMAAIVVVGLGAGSRPLAQVVAGSTGSSGGHVARSALLVMAPAAGLQLLAVGFAVRGAVERRLVPVAFAYMGSAVMGLVSFLPLYHAARQTVLAWTTLVASATLVALLLLVLGRPGWRTPRLRSLPPSLALLLRDVPLPVCFVLMYPVTLALVPHVRPGSVTAFGLAFTACSYLAGFTGQGLSMVDVAEHSELGLHHERRTVLVSRAFRVSMVVAAPLLAAAVLVGQPLLSALVSGKGASAAHTFADDLLLLAPWVVATLGLWATLPAIIGTTDRQVARLIGLGALALLVVHVVAALIGRLLAGLDGLVVAMAVAPAVFVGWALLSRLRQCLPSFAREGGAVTTVTVAMFGIPYLLATGAGATGLARGVIALLLGAVAYAGFVLLAFPHLRVAPGPLLRSTRRA